ncbi:MAG: hypothetical protein JST82_00890 [Bacteroidetes bacterium]|nr:hypothetical protein [Bacteroidota bacterium]
MHSYRVVFRENVVLSCFPTTQHVYINESNVIYHADNSNLSFALVKASSDKEAVAMATELLQNELNAKG